MDTTSRDAECVRKINTAKILHAFRRHGRMMSRPEIADRVNLSKVTVANIITDLTNEGGLLRSVGVGLPDRRGGRRPLLIELDLSRKRLLGATIGERCLMLTVCDITGRELRILRSQANGQSRMEILRQMVKDILASTNTLQENVLGLTIAVNSSDSEFGENEESKYTSQSLTGELGLEVQVMNLPQARAFGETWDDQSGDSDFFYLNLGVELTGIAVRRGCLELGLCDLEYCYLRPQPYGDTQEKMITIGEALAPKSFIKGASALYGGRPFHDHELCMLADRGDQIVSGLFHEYGYNLGCALSLIAHLGCFKQIVIGGYLTQAWPYFKDDVYRALDLHLSSTLRDGVEIRSIRPEHANGLYGARALALNHWIYHTELLNDRTTESHREFRGGNGFMERRP